MNKRIAEKLDTLADMIWCKGAPLEDVLDQAIRFVRHAKWKTDHPEQEQDLAAQNCADFVHKRAFAQAKERAETEPPITRKDLFAAAMFAGQVATGMDRPVAVGGAYQNAESDSLDIALKALKREGMF